MNSIEIIQNINTIYDRFFITPNLREHMLRAASVGKQICEHWQGPKINKEDIIAVLLIHDLGNIVKMDLETETGLKILGKEAQNIGHWKKIKKEIIQKYGYDDHEVTEKMANELNMSKQLIFILNHKILLKNDFILNSNDYNIKIAAYCDQRIGPFGILPLKVRFAEIKERYGKRTGTNLNTPKLDFFMECGIKIEEQIFQHLKITPDNINDQSIVSYFKSFQQKD